MIRIILSGCSGRMGKAVAAAADDGISIVAGVDINAAALSPSPFPIYENIADFSGEADVIVDFSHHSALSPQLR